MSGLVAIVGRPNVGKSTLFNRLVGSRKAIVEDIPGVTRDRIHGRSEFEGRDFAVVDTGGFDPNPDDPFLKIMKLQVDLALDEADAIIVVMDVKAGLTPVDREIHRMLSRRKKPVFYAVNKVDSPEKEREAFEFYEIGEEHVHFISATHGRGIGDMLERVVESLPPDEGLPPIGETPYVAVVGRPNVGKSTLINWLLGENRLLTSDIPGTTRDSVDTRWESPDGKSYVFVDTAGMRRKRSVKDAIEHYSVLRSIRSIERAHIVLLLLDGRLGMEEQDVKIANLVEKRGRSLAFVFNKWDLVDATPKTAQELVRDTKERYPSLSYVPALFTSAKTGRGITKLIPLVDDLRTHWEKRVPTGELNRFVTGLLQRNPPPLLRHRPGKVFYTAQPETCPPTFIFHVNKPAAFTDTYRRYLNNRIREEYKFTGSPIRLFFKSRVSGDKDR